jgi:hypothetical protein
LAELPPLRKLPPLPLPSRAEQDESLDFARRGVSTSLDMSGDATGAFSL